MRILQRRFALIRRYVLGVLLSVPLFFAQGAQSQAELVNWDNAFALQTNGGITNPLVLVGFNPTPDPAVGFTTNLGVSDPGTGVGTASTLTITNGVFEPDQTFRILFGLSTPPPFPVRFDAPGTPDMRGHFEFDAVDTTSGLTLFNIMFDLTTSSSGVPDDLSWFFFNPQPDPPMDFLLGGGAVIGFDFEFTSLSEAILVVQIQDAEGNALGFAPSPVPLPAALPLFLSALAGLGLMGWRRRTA